MTVIYIIEINQYYTLSFLPYPKHSCWIFTDTDENVFSVSYNQNVMTHNLLYSIMFSVMFLVKICFQHEWNGELCQLSLHHSGRMQHSCTAELATLKKDAALLCIWACITQEGQCRTQHPWQEGCISWGTHETRHGRDILYSLNQDSQKKSRSTGPTLLEEGSGGRVRGSLTGLDKIGKPRGMF